MIKFANEKEYIQKLLAAQKSGNETEIKEAWEAFHNSIAAKVKDDFEESLQGADGEILTQRGYRQLTSNETKWYQKVINALKSPEPKQAFAKIIGSDKTEDMMPTTIIEDVFRNLEEEHELLSAIDFQATGYATKWIINDHSTETAVWGDITAAITEEISSSFKVIDIDQYKLSAFALIEKGMLELGPIFLDGYIRKCLYEAIAVGLEKAIVSGTGAKQPIGLDRDIHEGVSFSTTDGYPKKSKEVVTSFAPAEYGALVAKLSKTESGKQRKFKDVGLICNENDYLTKVMPATTVLNANGVYVNNLFPIPTTVYISNALEDGEAILFLKGEYFMGIGNSREGVIEYSDDYKFVEDMRAFKIKLFGTGRAFDNTSSLLLDISGLEPSYITVQNPNAVIA